MYDFPHLKPHQTLRALTLSGGGIRGILSITLLAELQRLLREDSHPGFDILAGTSIGGIVCLGLAIGKQPRQLSEAFLAHSSKIFGSPKKLNFFGLRGAKHDPLDLKDVVVKILGKHAKRQISSIETPIVVVAVNANENTVEYFGNIDFLAGVKCRDASLLDVAMATSAAPLYFPPHLISERYYLDGGLISNNPDLEAFLVAMDHLSRSSNNLKMLSIGTGNFRPADISLRRPDPSSYSWMKPLALVDRVMQLQEQKPSLFVSSRLGKNYLRIEPQLSARYKLDDCRPDTLNSLIATARQAAQAAFAADSGRVASFFR